ncbi:sperm flagellar 2, partial [Homo sapiens]
QKSTLAIDPATSKEIPLPSPAFDFVILLDVSDTSSMSRMNDIIDQQDPGLSGSLATRVGCNMQFCSARGLWRNLKNIFTEKHTTSKATWATKSCQGWAELKNCPIKLLTKISVNV